MEEIIRSINQDQIVQEDIIENQIENQRPNEELIETYTHLDLIQWFCPKTKGILCYCRHFRDYSCLC